jgi:hypothetical protein
MIDIKKAIVTLAGNEVDFVLVGGVALGLHSAAYVTYDIDVCFSRTRENITRIVDALRPFEPRLRGFPMELPFIWDYSTLLNGTLFTLDTTIGDFDLLGELDGIGAYSEVHALSEKWTIYGYSVNVLSIDGLIKAKEHAGREKDVPGLKILYALKEANQEQEN